jgi:hypothetical protein
MLQTYHDGELQVVEATCQCLLAQAEEGEKEGQDEQDIEQQVQYTQ